MTRKRTFILGAGYSKQVGLPLATELTSCILDAPRMKGNDELQKWLADFKLRLARAEGTGEDPSRFSLNVEQLFDFAKYDEELWRMRQQLESVGRRCGETAWQMADRIASWLRIIEETLAHVIWDAQQHADLEVIKRLTCHLSADDTVVTFNYDTLVETALSADKQAWNSGLNDSGNGGVTVLKMHGSVDWIILERRQEAELQKFVRLFSKTDVNVSECGGAPPPEGEYACELWRAKDSNTCSAVMDMDKGGLSGFQYVLGLAGLGRYKPLHQLPGSARTWINAFRALKKAEEVYVIGFSMSPYDTMTRFHFSAVMHERQEASSRVVIVDPNAIHLAGAFSLVFGDSLQLTARRAEEVDWNRLL